MGHGEKKTNLARSLRKRGTPAEKRLWSWLRARAVEGQRFRRQAPIGIYVADFVCSEAKLIIELDGRTHPFKSQYETERENWLRAEGWEVLHIRNVHVRDNLAIVLEEIEGKCRSRLSDKESARRGKALPTPPPVRPDGRGSPQG